MGELNLQTDAHPSYTEQLPVAPSVCTLLEFLRVGTVDYNLEVSAKFSSSKTMET